MRSFAPTLFSPIGGFAPTPKRIHPSKPSNNYQSTHTTKLSQFFSDHIARDQIAPILLLRPFVVLPFQTISSPCRIIELLIKLLLHIFYKYYFVSNMQIELKALPYQLTSIIKVYKTGSGTLVLNFVLSCARVGNRYFGKYLNIDTRILNKSI